MLSIRRSALWSVVCVALLSAVIQAGSPRLARIVPPGGQAGSTVEIDLTGRYLDRPQEVLFYEPGIVAETIESLEGEVAINGRKERVEVGTRVRVRLKVESDCPLGPHGLRLRTASGVTEYQRFFVGPFPTMDEEESNNNRNDKRVAAKEVPINCTVLGRMNDAADVDLYRLEVQQGDRISAEIEAARIGVDRGIPDLHLTVFNSEGKALVEIDDSALYVQDPVVSVLAERAGTYYVQVRHNMYNATGDIYRLHLGNFPRPTALYPAGGPRGLPLSVQILGDPRGMWKLPVEVPADCTGDFPLVVTDPQTGVSAPSPNTLRISPFANVLEVEPNDSFEATEKTNFAELPIAFNGIINKPGDVDCFYFRAKKGDRYRIHALANTIGSPVDPSIWIKPASGKGATLRATDARANQLGLPPAAGLNRATLDPMLDFNVPADGDYVLGIEDDRGAGGSDFVYRIECQPDSDGIYTYIPPEPDNRFTPQLRQTVSVAAGNRYNTQVAIVTTDRPYDGDLELVAIGLPKGVTMIAPRLTPGATRVPVVFEAAADVRPQAAFIDLLVRPVGESKAPFASGYRQVVTMNLYGNNDFYLHTTLDKLLVTVTEPAPFSISVEEPALALVQNGEAAVKFTIQRAEGFDGAVTVAMEWRPGGITGSTPITIAADKHEGLYLLAASRNATAGVYPVTLTASSGAARASYYDTSNRSYVASGPIQLTVSEPHLEGRFARTSIERGKTADLVCKLNHLKPFSGPAKATLARLPRGVELVEPMREIKPGDTQVVFQVRATEDALLGNYQGVALDLTVMEEGQPLRQISGNGMLRIDPQRGTGANAK